jgi:hypothetical protein
MLQAGLQPGRGGIRRVQDQQTFFFAFRLCTCDRYNDVIELLH